MSIERFSSGLILVLIASIACMTHAWSQSYPARPIRIIVPFEPGGGVDFVARLVGQRFSESLGQPVVIENRGGGGGMVGTGIGARAVPDGYTLIMGNNSTHGVNQALTPQLPYDTVRDFASVSLIAAAPHLLVTPTSLPANSVKDLIALAKAKPKTLNFASAGTGSQSHLSGELFKYMTSADIVHIPYKGTGPGYTALLGGEVQLMFGSTPGALPLVQAGRLKALGITGEKRSQLLPNMPTLGEQGVAGFEAGPWYALLGPAGMPKAIVARLNQEVVKIVQTADFREKLSSQGAEPVGSTPEACARVIANELAKWTKLVKQINLRVN